MNAPPPPPSEGAVDDWSLRATVQFEAAVDALSQLVGACSAGIAYEQASASPDAQRLRQYEELSREFTRRQQALRLSEPMSWALVLTEFDVLQQRVAEVAGGRG